MMQYESSGKYDSKRGSLRYHYLFCDVQVFGTHRSYKEITNRIYKISTTNVTKWVKQLFTNTFKKRFKNILNNILQCRCKMIKNVYNTTALLKSLQSLCKKGIIKLDH